MTTLLPEIHGDESFDVLVAKLSTYFNHAIDSPATFETLRTTKYISTLRPLVQHLTETAQHKYTVAALLALKGHFSAAEPSDDRDIYASKARACELVAWRFVVRLSDQDVVDNLCIELPSLKETQQIDVPERDLFTDEQDEADLLDGTMSPNADLSIMESEAPAPSETSQYFVTTYGGMSALEIAAVTESKNFMAQKAIQRIINGIWNGDIVFWDSLKPGAKKRAKFYQSRRSDPYCRLRVPLYMKAFEVLFMAGFLTIYYVVLVSKPIFEITAAEIALYIWLAAFAHNEFGEFWDAGLTLYSADFWALWDLLIIVDGLAFFITRMIGLSHGDRAVIDIAFDILSLEALLLVPRICSVLSLLPYFGSLLPCLKEMTKDFVKFLGLIAILYLGFNTTFAFLARGTYSFSTMSYILVKVFFGSSYLGFDVADKISPILGPPLMIVFVCLTNILLVTSLISLLSNTLSRVMQHSRDEYLFVYSVFVVEAASSNRLVLFIPPLNLVGVLLRPLRLVVSAEALRSTRILLFKALHWPLVACIIAYEQGRQFALKDRQNIVHSTHPLRQPLSFGKPSTTTIDPGSAFAIPRATYLPNPPAQQSETIEALEMLALNLQQQLDAVHSLIQREKASRMSSSST